MARTRDEMWRQVIETAKAILSGRLDLITGCRELRRLVADLDISDMDIFAPIIGFESETDDYPVGEARRRYSKDYLDRLDQEVSEYVARAKPVVLATCRRIVAELGE